MKLDLRCPFLQQLHNGKNQCLRSNDQSGSNPDSTPEKVWASCIFINATVE